MTSSDNKPKISIIIPVYNLKQYLAEALESVINQTYKNLEIIVVDDGSDDGSEKICDAYSQKDSRIKVIHQENQGLSAARNTGLDNISGDYIAFLDADDVLHPKMIQMMAKSILTNNVDCVICQKVFFKTKQKINLKQTTEEEKHNQITYSKKEALKAMAEDKINAYVWDKLYKRELFNDVLFPVGKNYEDIYISLKIFNKIEKLLALNNKLIWYRKHPNSITSSYSLNNIQDCYQAYEYFESFIKKHMPEIYTETELKQFQNRRLNIFIYKYAYTLHHDVINKKEVQNWLKEKIRELNLNNEVREYNIETRLIFYLMFNHPKIFSFCAIFYSAIRKPVIRTLKKFKK